MRIASAPEDSTTIVSRDAQADSPQADVSDWAHGEDESAASSAYGYIGRTSAAAQSPSER